MLLKFRSLAVITIAMWKNLKSYFIVEEEGKKPTAKTLPDYKTASLAVQPTRTAKPASAAPAAAPSFASAPKAGSVNDRSIKVLMEAMEAANLPGFDYLEFKKALQNLKKMNFTDSVRFQTAFAAAESMGATPKQLEDSADHYLKVLEAENQKFANALAGQRRQQVSDKEQQLTQIDADIQRQEAKIKELQAQIEKLKVQQEKLQTTIDTSTEKLDQTQADFEATLQVITGGISQDIANIKEFLK